MELITLNNGYDIPQIGYGTATITGEKCVDSVIKAIDCGYRLIDTASEYRNEEAVGEAVARCGVPRDELFISSKLWNADHGYENTKKAFDESLRRFGLDYLDLYLIHWPNPKNLRDIGYEAHNADTWRAMEELYDEGKIRAIGISNFKPHHIEALLEHVRIKPMINQICLHPGRTDAETVRSCRDRGIVLQAYSPLGAGKIFGNAVIEDVAKNHGKDSGQVILRWHIQNGFIPLPRTVKQERMRSNMDIFDFKLTEVEMRALNELDVNIRILPDPDEADF